MNLLGSAALVAFATIASAASNYNLQVETQLVKTNQAKWNAYLNSTNCGAYTMKFARDCFCPPDWRGPYQAIVNSTGQIASAFYLFNSDNQDLSGKPIKVPTGKVLSVKDVFNEIKRALNQKVDGLEVTYHEDWGYPKEVFIDWDELIADEEDRYTIENVIRL